MIVLLLLLLFTIMEITIAMMITKIVVIMMIWWWLWQWIIIPRKFFYTNSDSLYIYSIFLHCFSYILLYEYPIIFIPINLCICLYWFIIATSRCIMNDIIFIYEILALTAYLKLVRHEELRWTKRHVFKAISMRCWTLINNEKVVLETIPQ